MRVADILYLRRCYNPYIPHAPISRGIDQFTTHSVDYEHYSKYCDKNEHFFRKKKIASFQWRDYGPINYVLSPPPPHLDMQWNILSYFSTVSPLGTSPPSSCRSFSSISRGPNENCYKSETATSITAQFETPARRCRLSLLSLYSSLPTSLVLSENNFPINLLNRIFY
jgi:hypothetical protein